MSRQNKNTTRKAQAKVITAMHLRGEKGPKRGPASKKTNAWWMKGTYSTFINGKQRSAETNA